MSTQFSSTISALRKEKKISQKAAADALGISQALLSHYENGIRECSLEFVKKAAVYYEVSTDYLLGVNASKHLTGELYSTDQIATDTSINLNTVLRSIIFLSDLAEKEGDEAKIIFDNYFSLAVKKYINAICKTGTAIDKLCDATSSFYTDKINPDTKSSDYGDEFPLTIKTIDQHCNMLISKYIAEII